jgi:hypothetical protein
MPATILAHQALVLPLKLRWPARFSGLALCIGSMAPDLEFIFRLSDDWLFSHTLAAQLYFSVPITLLLVWLLTAVFMPVVLPFVQDHPRLRLHDLAALHPPSTMAEWRLVGVSALIGGLSHWLLDGITHGGHSGWAVPHLPWLGTMVPHLGGRAPLHDALQLWLTVLFGLASAGMYAFIVRHRLLWRWRGRAPVELPRRTRAEGVRLLAAVALLLVQGGVAGYLLRGTEEPKLAAAGVAFGAVNAALAGTMLFAVALQARRRPSRPLWPRLSGVLRGWSLRG